MLGDPFQKAACVCSPQQLANGARRAARICQLRHDQVGQGPTEPHADYVADTFLLSSGGVGGEYY